MKNRILFFLLVCFFGISTMVAQTNMVQHEVKRGETMESIAKQYNVSPEEIKEVNPQMGNYFYVGLKLNIPTKTEDKYKDAAVITNSLVETDESDDVIIENREGNTDSFLLYQPNSNISQGDNINKEYLEGVDYFFSLHTKDYFSISIGVGSDMDNWLYGYYGFGVTSIKGFNGRDVNFEQSLGVGAKYRERVGSLLLQAMLFPYGSLYTYNDYKTDSKKSEVKVKFTYGASANASVGLKAWTTKNNNDTYITVGYYMNAPKFRTQGMVKNGAWLFGLTTIFN